MRFVKFFLLFFFFISSDSIAKNQLVYFEPKYVSLDGIIRKIEFAGPPNYESIKNGDADETGPYLVLNHQIDVQLIPKSQSDINVPEKNIKLLQLVVENNNDWPKIKEGNYVHIIGTLFHAHTGHHHSRVLLMINKITVLSKKKITGGELDITNEDKEFMKQ